MTEFADFLSGNWLASAGTTFLLVGLAEIGDKSQLVCMTLAARHRGLPVAIGAVSAFAVLNLLAVVFGAAVAAWLPEWLVTLAVAALFAFFGINALRYRDALTQYEKAKELRDAKADPRIAKVKAKLGE